MGIITTILLIFLIVIVLVLIIPFHITLQLQKYGGDVRGLFELRWLRIRIFKKDFPEEDSKEKGKEVSSDKREDKEITEVTEALEKETEEKRKKEDKKEKETLRAEEEEEEEEEEKAKKKRSWKWADIKKILKLSWEAGIYLIQFLGDIFNSISLHKFNLHVIWGMDSPVDTANHVGYMWAAASLLNLSPTVHISAEPSFFNPRMDGELFLDFKIRMIRPIFAVLKLLTKKPVLKLLWELRRYR